jgi:hypothetical protein
VAGAFFSNFLLQKPHGFLYDSSSTPCEFLFALGTGFRLAPRTTLQKTESAVMIRTLIHPRRSAARSPRSHSNPRATVFSLFP